MKKISFWLALVLFTTPLAVRAQDAATEERLNKLTAQIQDLVEAQGAQSKRIDALAKELQTMQQERQNQPAANYASHDDLKELAAKLKEVDNKRQEDNDHVLAVLKSLGKNLGTNTGRKPAVTPKDESGTKAPTVPEKGFEHEVKSGQTLSAIIQAYRDQNIKVTLKQVLDANPGLKPEKMYVGQKIFIPAPQ